MTTDFETPRSDAKIDAEGALAMLAALMNAANQSTSGSTAGTSGNTNQLGSGTNASEVSVQAMADINTPESLSSYTGLAVSNATGHLTRVNAMSEQILQNAITQANSVATNAISDGNKMRVDASVVGDMLHMQAVRHMDLATDRIWNIDEQVAAAEVLYAALGKFIGSQDILVTP